MSRLRRLLPGDRERIVTREPGDAVHRQREALELFRAAGESNGEAAPALRAMADAHAELGDHDSAIARCTEATRIYAELDDRWAHAAAPVQLGHLKHAGDLPAAKESGRPALAIAGLGGLAVLAAAVIVGLLVVRDDSGEAAGPGSSTPAATFPMAGKLAWRGPSGESSSSNDLRQAWATDELLAYANLNTGLLTAVSKATGVRAWRHQLPQVGAGGQRLICAASKDVLNGAVAIVFGRPGAPHYRECTGLMLFDLTTGKPRHTVKEHVFSYGAGTAGVEVAAGMVMHSVSRRLDAYDVITGARRWSLDLAKQSGDCDSARVGPDARELVAVGSCGERAELWTIDPVSSRVLARTVLNGAADMILSMSPVVTYTLVGKVAQVLSTDRRRVQNTIPLDAEIGTNSPEGPLTVRVWKTYLIAEQLSPAPPISVWDLRTGRRLWSRTVPVGEVRRRPIGATRRSRV